MDGPDGAGGALGGDGGAGALADEGAGGAGGAEGALGEAAAERDDEDAGKAADEGGAGGGGGSARDEAAEAEAPAAAGAEGGAPDGREGAAAEAHARKIAKRARKSAAAAASAPVRRRPLSALERQAGDWRPWGQPCYFRREEQPASAFAEGELAEAAPEEEATAAAARDARERRLREEMAALAPARVAYKERAVLAQLRDAALARGTALRAPGRALGRALVAAEAAEAQLREELGSAPERELEHEESRLRAAREKARRAQEAVRATWLHPDQRTKARAAETASALRDQAAAVARLRGKMERFGALGGELAELRRATAAVSLGATAWEVRAEGLARDAAAAGRGAAPLLVLEGRGSGRPVSPPLRVHVRDPRPRARAPAAAPPALPQTLRLGRRGSERRAGGAPAADGAARGGGAAGAGVGGAGARRGAAGIRSGWVWREEANGVTGQSDWRQRFLVLFPRALVLFRQPPPPGARDPGPDDAVGPLGREGARADAGAQRGVVGRWDVARVLECGVLPEEEGSGWAALEVVHQTADGKLRSDVFRVREGGAGGKTGWRADCGQGVGGRDGWVLAVRYAAVQERERLRVEVQALIAATAQQLLPSGPEGSTGSSAPSPALPLY